MLTKQDLIAILIKEYSTTLRVMRAFPPDKKDFKPHERSQEAIRLVSTFIFEMYLLESYLFGDQIDRSRFSAYKPENMEAAIADFEKESSQVIERMDILSDDDFKKPIQFAGREFSADEFTLMMIHDQIHHRGQLSVYVRMAGGKVPSIYGPSADDTSTNL